MLGLVWVLMGVGNNNALWYMWMVCYIYTTHIYCYIDLSRSLYAYGYVYLCTCHQNNSQDNMFTVNTTCLKICDLIKGYKIHKLI